LMGGSGSNNLDGKGGTNTVSYLFSKGSIAVNLSSLNIDSIFSPTDAAPLYLDANLANGGFGEVNDTIKNVQNLQGSVYDDILVAGNAAPSGVEYESKNGYDYTGSYIDGSQGNDLIYAGAGSDILDGGQGINWLSYALSTASVAVDLRPSFLLNVASSRNSGGYAADDIIIPAKDQYQDNKGVFTDLSSFRNLEGSTFNDTLRGDIGDNIIRGGDGKDEIYGDEGNDTLIGGAEADKLDGEEYTGTLRAQLAAASIAEGNRGGGNTASYADSSGAVTVNLNTRSGQNSDAEGDELYNIHNLIGSDRADILIGGNEFSNDINAGLSSGGTDIVSGGTTALTYSLTLDYSLGDYGAGAVGGFTAARGGGITRSSSDGSATLDAVSFSNIDRLFFTGTIQADNITGGANADVIFGGAGNDTINGGSGDDYLDGGDGIDTLSDNLSNFVANFNLTGIDPNDPNAAQFNGTNFASSSFFGTVTIKNFEVFKDITTGGGADRIVQPGRVNNIFNKAGFGSNYVDPGIGFDTVDGGALATNRILHMDYAQGDTGSGILFSVNPFVSPTVKPTNNSGFGFRYVSPTFDNTTPVLDNIFFNNFDRFEVTGTSQNDFIQGGEGNDDLNGGSGGFDTIVGGRGNDTLRASAGGSTLIGTNNFDRGFDTFIPGPPGSFGSTVRTYDLAQDQDTLYGGAGADTFVLGDTLGTTNSIVNSIAPGGIYYAHSFYDGSNNDNDNASILNFDPSQGDVIQLRNLQGYSARYTLFNFFGTEILSLGYTDKNGIAKSDVLAFISGNFTSLNLNSSAFSYVGDPYTPPIIR
jgi:hypothetical protein